MERPRKELLVEPWRLEGEALMVVGGGPLELKYATAPTRPRRGRRAASDSALLDSVTDGGPVAPSQPAKQARQATSEPNHPAGPAHGGWGSSSWCLPEGKFLPNWFDYS
ncbi:unnamed protein product [Heligmosomoides polygyrus]|uniref:Uncharacterized protein n=1 Tax=Heligmosomoides polygyrus TaxID=6339 RepID=A0A183FH77_HELPZ|nr:unnamed protein product [Heligmosomoides polygyrus]